VPQPGVVRTSPSFLRTVMDFLTAPGDLVTLPYRPGGRQRTTKLSFLQVSRVESNVSTEPRDERMDLTGTARSASFLRWALARAVAVGRGRVTRAVGKRDASGKPRGNSTGLSQFQIRISELRENGSIGPRSREGELLGGVVMEGPGWPRGDPPRRRRVLPFRAGRAQCHESQRCAEGWAGRAGGTRTKPPSIRLVPVLVGRPGSAVHGDQVPACWQGRQAGTALTACCALLCWR
jgi:hypothetical protein